MPDRTCVIHIGTHKTGTTSLQYFLMQQSEELERHGLYFPKTGWYGVVPGHHAIAWELAHQPDSPGALLNELIAELAAKLPPTALLSAEDFSLLASRARALETFAKELRGIGYSVKILVYLRAQGPFAESMYVERVKHGFIRPIPEFVKTVVSTGQYGAGGVLLPIEFHYSRMLAAFADVFGEAAVHARPYLGVSDVAAIFNDFLDTLAELSDFVAQNLRLPITHPVVNESLSFARLLGTVFSRLHPDRPVPATARAFIAEYAPDLPAEYSEQRFALFSRDEHREILRSVADDNALVQQRFGVHVPFSQETDLPRAIDAAWAKALIERRIYDRCLKEWLTNEQ